MTRRKSRRLRPGRLMFLIAVFIFLLGGIASLGYVAYALSDMPAFNPASLENMVPTSVYDKDGNLVTRIGTENREPIKLDEVPQVVKDAFLATEDDRFYDHHGINFRSLGRALFKNLASGEIREGFSTITMQLVKLSYLSPERSIKRKLQEIVLTLQVERHFTKDEIFEMYLNKIYFGQGAYGIQSAAQTYFGKDLKKDELTLEEAAFLAGLPQAPSVYSRYLDSVSSLEEDANKQKLDKNKQQDLEKQQKDYDLALNRRNTVLLRMKEAGKITEQQRQEAAAKPLPDGTQMPTSRYPYPYFIDYVTEKLVQKYGPDMVYKGGLKVYTTLDPKIQKTAETAMANAKNFPNYPPDKNGLLQPQGAAVFMEPGTGYLRAIVGGREHKQQRQLNRATQYQVLPDGRKIGRQPGSAIKPIVAYGPAIEFNGLGPASVIDDIPTSFGNYSPKNADGNFRGLITMRTALTHSVNIVAIKLLQQTGLEKAVKFAHELGITTLDANRDGLAMALGGVSSGVVPLDMAGAYGAFANQGIYVKPHAITRVEGPDGTLLDEFKPEKKRVMKATTAYLITDMLRSVVQSGTGTRANLGARPVAGKTGTTDEGKDIWFIGYTPELVGAVWIGHDAPKKMPQAYGGIYPAMIWREVMSKVLADVPVRPFNKPEGIVTATVDSKSGLLPGPNTPPDHLVTDLFAAGTVPTETDNLHQVMEVCATTGDLPNEFCPERITKVVIKLPYAVPSNVADYALRAPVKTCTLHNANGIDPAAAEKYKTPFLPTPETSQPADSQPNNDIPTKQPNNNDSWLPGTTGSRQADEKADLKRMAKIKAAFREASKE
ncbi:transglycosylase domain-containing protein [Desulforamulus hydrothermalis]|uniref:Penicillin-binding protein 1A n=1 Tax=Desulforamulus hydrothermalis Lam5 = DSM 18033 TaxID=1121428 RepID=K8DXC2_9FIRM|nr:penicillin-binding protein 1A [Desulforamulus hydrothermalis]CCO07247.1 Penicillin-binding protein, 1A family [Desulforamulus hydrothermalis Lam5 = DSM 18033]SHG92237.1 penicillin-binding protein 1A [Desulforamulus hydrothermalis Lam5 = DSM 18033]